MTIKGTAFLWHQVRCMVAVLFLIGQGLESPSVSETSFLLLKSQSLYRCSLRSMNREFLTLRSLQVMLLCAMAATYYICKFVELDV